MMGLMKDPEQGPAMLQVMQKESGEIIGKKEREAEGARDQPNREINTGFAAKGIAETK